MSFWRRLTDRITGRADRDLDRELGSHLDLEAEEQQAGGLPPEAARCAAQRAFGNMALIKEDTRSMWGWGSVETLIQDLRYGGRTLRKDWGFTTAAVLTLALGIGANSAVFSVVYAVLIDPMPYPQADRLVVLSARNSAGSAISLSYPDVMDWKAQTQVLERLAAYQAYGFTLTGVGDAERLPGRAVSAEFFSTLGVAPTLGRDFRAEDDGAGSRPVVILSHQAWSQNFHGDLRIIGRDITLNGRSFTVVGVLPASFQLFDTGDVFAPIGLGLLPSKRGERRGIYAIGRLRRDATVTQAQAEADVIAGRLARQYPDTNAGTGARVVPLAESFVGKTKLLLLVLLGAVTFVLLIACANVANLLLARAASRQREIAIRMALGAAPSRLFRQMLTESVLLAVTASVCGMLLTAWSMRAINALLPEHIQRLKHATVNGWVLGFTLLLSLATALLFGLAPSWQTIKAKALGVVHANLREGARGTISGAGQRSLRDALVLCEVALCAVLLVGASLMIRTLLTLQRVDPGFRATNVLRTQIILPPAQYSPDRQISFFAQLLDRARSLPGVEAASLVMCLPLSGGCWSQPMDVAGRVEMSQGPTEVNFNAIAPGYFRAMGIPLLAGRDFDSRDAKDAPAAAIISQSLASRYFSGQNPIGQRVRQRSPSAEPWMTVVGIVGDVRRSALDTPAEAEVYRPFPQSPVNFMTLVVRTAGNPLGLSSAIRNEVRVLDKEVPLQAIATMEQLHASGVATRHFPALLLGLFAAIALVLAVVGIYGLIAYSVSQRTSEIGIRIALGAKRTDVLRLVVAQGMTPVWLGMISGLAGAFALSRTMSSFLYGVSPMDPVTFAVVPLAFLSVGLLACAVPARRASCIDPILALRNE